MSTPPDDAHPITSSGPEVGFRHLGAIRTEPKGWKGTMRPQSSAGLLVGLPTPELVLERLPDGELAWLRSEPAPEPRYVLTDAGRRALAVAACFGPWPTVAEAQP